MISEVPFDIERLAELRRRTTSANPRNYAIVDDLGGRHRWSAAQVVEYGRGGRLRPHEAGRHRRRLPATPLKQLTGEDIIYQQLAYLMRAGAPGLARPHGGDLLRQPGGRPAAAGPQRPHGGAAERHIHDRAGRHVHRRA